MMDRFLGRAVRDGTTLDGVRALVADDGGPLRRAPVTGKGRLELFGPPPPPAPDAYETTVTFTEKHVVSKAVHYGTVRIDYPDGCSETWGSLGTRSGTERYARENGFTFVVAE